MFVNHRAPPAVHNIIQIFTPFIHLLEVVYLGQQSCASTSEHSDRGIYTIVSVEQCTTLLFRHWHHCAPLLAHIMIETFAPFEHVLCSSMFANHRAPLAVHIIIQTFKPSCAPSSVHYYSDIYTIRTQTGVCQCSQPIMHLSQWTLLLRHLHHSQTFTPYMVPNV